MIRITRQTDYGIIVLTYLATAPRNAAHTARDVAAGCRLPLPMVSKILKALARGGLLLSHRGVKGGYSLARDPDTISVARIIQVLEGPIAVTECAESPGNCEQEPLCPVRDNWLRINLAIKNALDRIPLSEMMAPQPALLSLDATAAERTS